MNYETNLSAEEFKQKYTGPRRGETFSEKAGRHRELLADVKVYASSFQTCLNSLKSDPALVGGLQAVQKRIDTYVTAKHEDQRPNFLGKEQDDVHGVLQSMSKLVREFAKTQTSQESAQIFQGYYDAQEKLQQLLQQTDYRPSPPTPVVSTTRKRREK